MTQKIPKRVQALLDRLARQERLCKFLRRKETGETEILFFLEPSGMVVGTWTAERAIKMGLLEPACDGLFSADYSQTFLRA